MTNFKFESNQKNHFKIAFTLLYLLKKNTITIAQALITIKTINIFYIYNLHYNIII